MVYHSCSNINLTFSMNSTLESPKISIILPTYNGERFLEESIESILKQTYKNFELIIVNDASTDETLTIAEKYKNRDKRIKVITNVINQKLPESLNIGFREACGEYFTWTSDDNIFKDNALAVLNDYLDNHTNCDFVSSNFDFIRENGSLKTDSIISYPSRESWHLAFYCNIGACFLYRSSVAKIVGEYDKNLFCAEDYDYWCRFSLVGNISFIDDNLYSYRVQSKSLSATKKNLVLSNTIKVTQKYMAKILKRYKLESRKISDCLLKRFAFNQNCKLLLQSFKYSLFYSISYCIYNKKYDIHSEGLKILRNVYGAFKNCEHIIIWGTGEYGKFVKKSLDVLGFTNNLRGFCNTFKENNCDECLLDIPVFSPKEVSEKYPNNLCYIASESVNDIIKYKNENKKFNLNIFVSSSDVMFFEKSFSNFYSNPSEYNFHICLFAIDLLNKNLINI